MSEDHRFMTRALRLAERGFTHPNPMVGCVLVANGAVVGEGYHLSAGGPHAEIAALGDAGTAARGATAYVTLEPCAHFGRTPPCTEALIEGGVRRVVVAVEDPNPRVSGKGLLRLREAGIAVDVGVLAAKASRLNEAFFHYQTTQTPFVTLKSAQTMDGKIATHSGDSRWISGEKAREFVHGLRARSGAVLVGIGTAMADDPMLTARLRPAPPRQPLRIVLDSRLRLTTDSLIARTAHEYPTLVVTTQFAEPAQIKNLQTCCVEILVIQSDTCGRIDLTSLIQELGRREIVSLLVEGGGEIHAAFLEAKLANRLLWFIAPKVIGGRQAPSAVGGTGAARMEEAVRIESLRSRRFGPDILLDGVPVWGE